MYKVKNQKIIACKIATNLDPNTQVPSSDVITSLCWYSSVKKGMKGVCLRKWWGKCYRRCIVKFDFLAFIEWISTFYYVYL